VGVKTGVKSGVKSGVKLKIMACWTKSVKIMPNFVKTEGIK
jgi:hypothetical protein